MNCFDTIRLLVGLALSCHIAVAQSSVKPGITYAQLLKEHNLNLWADVLRIAGIGDLKLDPTARFAAFVPDDAAVRSFLDSMGLDLGGLRARPRLAKDLAAMSLVLAVPPELHKAVAAGTFKTVPTSAQGPYTTLTVDKTPGGVQIMDGQGQEANVLQYVRLGPNQSGIIIDKVLMSGSYYTGFASLCNHRAQLISDVCWALLKAGILPSIRSRRFDNTIFMPGNKAFAAAGYDLASITSNASIWQSGLGDTFLYSVVPGIHAIPGGFVPGKSYNTLLPGAQLKVVYDKVENGLVQPYVVPASGSKVPVVVSNVFVGQAIVHGVAAVFKLPPAAKRTAAESAPAKPAQPRSTTSSSSRGSTTNSSNKGRLLLGFADLRKSILPMNAAETQIRGQVNKMTKDQQDRWG